MSAFRPLEFHALAYDTGQALPAPMSFAYSGFTGDAADRRHFVAKRVLDILLSLANLAIFGGLMLLIAAAIRMTSDGPALFHQQRIGLHGRRFVMLKFRTMRHSAENPNAWHQATRDDPRVTRIGGWLRRTSLDELPQLLNVLGGSMSMVGPRPHAPNTRAAGRPFELVTDRYAARHCVKPGMTGLAQVRGWRGETDTEEKLIRRVDSDLEYIATCSVGGDLLIIWRTIATVLRMPNAY